MAEKRDWRNKTVDPLRLDHFEIEAANVRRLKECIDNYIVQMRQFAVTPTATGWTITSPRPMEDQPELPRAVA